MAAQLKATMPPASMMISAENAASAGVQNFMALHSARSIRPLYPAVLRSAQQRNSSPLGLAASVRQTFPKRARRLAGPFAPPDLSRTYILELQNTLPEESSRVLALLRSDPAVEFAEEDTVSSITAAPNDPFFGSYGTWGQGYDDLWGIKKIGVPAVWDTNAGNGVVVAVVDTGVDRAHQDVASNVWINTREIAGNGADDDGNGYVDDTTGWNFVSNNYNPTDDHGHGSHVSGIIAATGNNAIGIIGVAWLAKVMTLKGLDKDGNGWDSGLAQAIVYAANNGADVINASWGHVGDSYAIAEAVDYAHNLGVVVVAAAGNDSSDARWFTPANLEQVITIAASTPDDALASFSNFGTKIDIAAPGVDILSLRASGTSLGAPLDAYYTRANGTSLAAPHVSGAVALLLSQHAEYSSEQVRQVLRASATDTGDPGVDPQFGYGRLNAAAAMAIVNPLEATITGPAEASKIDGPVAILGVAVGEGFSRYDLEYGVGDYPTSWVLFATSRTPVSGELGTFDPSGVPHGNYTIRLTAYNVAGQGFADQVHLSTNHVAIARPRRDTYKNGATVAITGTVVLHSLQNYTVEWAKGANASSGWQSTGIALTSGGTANIRDGVLATWDTSSIAEVGYYSLRLIVNAGTFTDEIRSVLYLEPDLVSMNWPKWLEGTPYYYAGLFPVLDAAGNSQLGIMTPWTNPAILRKYAPDGSEQASIELMNSNVGRMFQPAAANLDGNGDSIIIGGRGGVDVLRPNLTSYNLRADAEQADFSRSHMLLEDVDGDSQLELLTVGSAINLYTGPLGTAYVYAWRKDGQLLSPQFPISIPDHNLRLVYYSYPRAVTGDIDGDGSKEIVVLEGTSESTFTPRLFTSDGTSLPWAAPTLAEHCQQLVLADLDHNGRLETLIYTYDGKLHVLQPDGTERAGWPQQSRVGGWGTIAVGDLNRDGQEEIVMSMANDLRIFNANGTPFSTAWPKLLNSGGFGPAVIADVNGDGYPDIVTSFEEVHYDVPVMEVGYITSELLAFDGDGTKIKSWTLSGANGYVPNSMQVYLTVGDFDKDGLTEIAACYTTFEPPISFIQSGVITVLTTHEKFSAAANDWPMVFRNARNSPVLQRMKVASVSVASSLNPAVMGQAVDFAMTVNAVEAGSHVPAGRVNLVEGQTTLGSCALASGRCTVSLSSLLGGSHSLAAAYAGDNNFSPAVSSALVQQIVNPDFALSSSSQRTVTAGQAASFTISVAPNPAPYNYAVSGFTCSGLPTGAKCTFTPTSVTPGDGAANVALSITTTARTLASIQPGFKGEWVLALTFGSGAVGFLALCAVGSRKKNRPSQFLLLAVLAYCGFIAACGGGGGAGQTPGPQPNPDGTPAGTYAITISATGNGGVSHSSTVSLIVK